MFLLNYFLRFKFCAIFVVYNFRHRIALGVCLLVAVLLVEAKVLRILSGVLISVDSACIRWIVGVFLVGSFRSIGWIGWLLMEPPTSSLRVQKLMSFLLETGRCYIKWFFRVRPDSLVVGCFRCMGFVHRVAEWRTKSDAWSDGQEGHKAAGYGAVSPVYCDTIERALARIVECECLGIRLERGIKWMSAGL